MNRNDNSDGGLGVAFVALVTSQTKVIDNNTSKELPKDIKFWGALSWSGMIYIGGEPSKVDWRSWAKDFKQGYSFAKGVENKGSGFDYFVPEDTKNMELVIDTSSSTSIKFPNWTGINPYNSSVK